MIRPSNYFYNFIVVKYRDFDAALRQAQLLIEAGALSVETVDSRVLGLAKLDPVWVKASPYIEEVPGAEINGVNIVEFAGSDPAADSGGNNERDNFFDYVSHVLFLVLS